MYNNIELMMQLMMQRQATSALVINQGQVPESFAIKRTHDAGPRVFGCHLPPTEWRWGGGLALFTARLSPGRAGGKAIPVKQSIIKGVQLR